MTESNEYLARGVSSSKTDVHHATRQVDPGLFPGAFCKVLPDTLSGDPDYCLLMHADGAGTKSSLAYLYWRETGDLSVFRGIAVDSLVMNLDDMACSGAVDRFLLSNTIGRNRFRIPGRVIETIIEGFVEFIEKMADHQLYLEFCGGETADIGDLVRTLVVDSTLTARIRRDRVVDLHRIRPGDRIIGFAGFGQCRWESDYNSGIGSNGLTAARHDCLDRRYAERYPETYAPEIPPAMVYCGNSLIGDPLPETPLNLGQALLSPTRTYAPLIRRLLLECRESIHGLVHCTGGGQTKCLKFGQGLHYVKDNLFPLPPVFAHLRNVVSSPLSALFPVYNMGHRLEAFVDADAADRIIAVAADCGIEARCIGHCRATDGPSNRLTIIHDGETCKFQAPS
jgi:phosphoribosylformylglycinamidine cyclo-ligase